MKPIALVVSILAAAAGGAAGYFVGKNSVQPEAPKVTDNSVLRGTAPGSDSLRLAKKKKEAVEEGPGAGVGGSGVQAAKSLGEIMKTPGQLQRIEELLALAKSLGPDGIEEVFGELGKMGRGPDQIVAMQVLLARYAEIDPEKALSFAGEQNGMGRFFGSSSILRTWASTDPKAAAAHYVANIDSFDSGWGGGRMAGGLAMEWAKTDPSAAWDWVGQLPEGQQRDAYERVVQQLAASDPQVAISYAMKLEDSEMQARMLGEVADQWARTDPQASLDWAIKLEGEAQSRAIAETMESWARQDPEAALTAWASLPEGEGRSDALGDIMRSYTFNEPAAAASWVESLENPAEKVQAATSLMGTWLRTDAEAASAWLTNQPAGEVKDAGINQIINNRDLMRDDPGGAIAWANEISDPDQRLTSTTGIAAMALMRDRESGVTLVEEASLPQEQKEALLMLEDDQLREAAGLYRSQSGGGGGGPGGRDFGGRGPGGRFGGR